MSPDLGTRIHAFRLRVRRPFEGTSTRAKALRWVLAIALFLAALGFLIFLSWLLRGAGLWGDLAFAIVVTTGVFWIARRILQHLLHEGPFRALFRAFGTTIWVLVGGPVAYVTRPLGLALWLVPLLVWAGFRIAIWRKWWHRPWPLFWHAEVAGVVLLAIYLLISPSVGSVDRVPRAVPAETTQEGEQDQALAEAFRPLLFFDSGERRFPLDIQDAIADDRVEICRKAARVDDCDPVENAALIDANLDYLTLEEKPGTPLGGDGTSAVYYRVERPDGDDRVYVDYWWFFSRNPSPVADKVFCGPGLRTPPFTCQDHAGDWEGLTVVVAPCTDCEPVGDESLSPVEVRYGQHEHVVGYGWSETLRPFWDDLPLPRSAALQEIWGDVVKPAIDEAGNHPIAFVARNSHASYPAPCFGDCEQTTRDLPEARHDGGVVWSQNEDCDECVKPLPLTDEGDPALWNAFPGRWGEQRCILAGAYCDLSGAPKSPSFQRRYRNPAGEVEEFCLQGVRLVPC